MQHDQSDAARRHPSTLLAVAFAAILLLGGCNTFRGVGQDVEAGGRAIGDAADTTSEAIDEAVD